MLRPDRIRRHLEVALIPLARKAGRDRVRQIVAQVAAEGVDELHLGFARVLAEMGRKREIVRRAARVDAQVLQAAAGAGAIHAALVDAIERYPAAGSTRGDLAALQRNLDGTAIEDRIALAVHEVDQLWSFTAEGLARLDLTELDEAMVDELSRGADQVLASVNSPWWVRVSAARLLGALGLDRIRGSRARQSLLNAAQHREDDPWVVSTALELYLELPPPRREADSLLRPWWDDDGAPRPGHPDALFARARVVELAVRHGCQELARRAVELDPSEHVQMAAARALVLDPRGMDRDYFIELLHHSRTQGWRVAVATVLAVVRDAERTGDIDLGVMAQALSPEADDRVVHVALEAVWTRVRDGRFSSPIRHGLRTSWPPLLRSVRQRESSSADVRRLAAVLLTWADVDTDEDASGALAQIGEWIASADEGADRSFRQGPVAGLTADRLLDVLFLLSHDDLDLSATPLGDSAAIRDGDAVPRRGYRIHLGTRAGWAAWRFQHEFLNPRHDKRAAHPHLIDLLPPGPLVAWSARMSEVVATMVPARRVSSPVNLDWHEHLPLVQNLLVASAHGAARLRTPDGVILIEPASAASRIAAHREYVRLAELRLRLTEAWPAEAVVTWDEALTEAGYSVERIPREMAASVSPMVWLQYLSSADLHATTELGILSAGSLLWWAGTKVAREARLKSWRRAVPFIVGGWGSRGKSSVERLKSALFQGTGYSVVCKSTGCEAMMLVGLPGERPTEIFLYRPNDKATIVEQANVLQLAATMKPQVVLWECMALNPVYTGILQTEWMRDDLTTVTNTYPDHENIQGPTGRDVADVIANITPYDGELVTSEQHMSPVLRRRARDRRSGFSVAEKEHWELLPADVLARFPYEAHPRNVTLVTRMAGVLGLPADVAWRTMADNVLPDLGAFKTYGPADVDGREMVFVNGCSANDRASFLSNWGRKSLEVYDEQAGLGDRLVVVVNNRADRPARQAAFARIMALDVSADHIAVIGTNVLPMGDAIRASVREELRPRLLDLAAGHGGKAALVQEMARRLRRLPLDGPARAKALGSAPPGVQQHPAAEAWEEETAWLHDLSTRDDWDVAAEVDGMLTRFTSRLLLLEDPKLKGDQVLWDLALALPEGTRGTLLGCSNIKGTGLDFVYRWVGIQRVRELLAPLAGKDVQAMRKALSELASHPDYGLADARMARAVIAEHVDSGRFADLGLSDDTAGLLEHLTRVEAARLAKKDDRTSTGPSWTSKVAKVLNSVAIWKNVRRRAKADQLYEDLAHRRVGAVRAAEIAQQLVADEKG